MPKHLDDPDLAGSAILDGADAELVAGSHVSFRIIYRAGRLGVDNNGSIKVAYRTTSDAGGLQLDDPTAPGFTTLTTDGNARLVGSFEKWRHTRPWGHSLYIKVVDGFLRPGEHIIVNVGDRSGGSPGFRVQTFCEQGSPLRVFADPVATYSYVAVPEPEPMQFDVVAGPAAKWRAIVPPEAGIGEPFDLHIVAEDRWGNPTVVGRPASVTLRAIGPVAGLPENFDLAGDAPAVPVSGLRLEAPDPAWIEVLDSDGTALARSNPVVASASTGRTHFWGDLHIQTNETVGANTIRQMFTFARDIARVDVTSHQGNDFQITDAFWEDLNRATVEFNDEGRFVVFPGYEWSGNTGTGGDHNVWYRREGGPLVRSSRALVPNETVGAGDANTTADMFDALRGEDVVIAAHCGGRYADISLAHDPLTEHSVEIHSSWGTFEWLLQDAFRLGYRMGIVGNSDDHKSRPGASYPGASNFGALGGLTCFLADGLTREAIFTAMKRRHHYATSGSRPFLDVSGAFASGADVYETDPEADPAAACETLPAIRMGDIAATVDGTMTLRAEMVTRTPLLRLEIRGGSETLEVIRPYGEADLGRRICVQWRGASFRGRNRQARWDGTARLTGNRFLEANAINFWNAERGLQTSEAEISWKSTTTGGFSGFMALLDDAGGGTLEIDTPLATLSLPIADIGLEPTVVEAGGIDCALEVFRLPDVLETREFEIERTIPLQREGDTRIFVSLVEEDGHRAWSSPMYVFRKP